MFRTVTQEQINNWCKTNFELTSSGEPHISLDAFVAKEKEKEQPVTSVNDDGRANR